MISLPTLGSANFATIKSTAQTSQKLFLSLVRKKRVVAEGGGVGEDHFGAGITNDGRKFAINDKKNDGNGKTYNTLGVGKI